MCHRSSSSIIKSRARKIERSYFLYFLRLSVLFTLSAHLRLVSMLMYRPALGVQKGGALFFERFIVPRKGTRDYTAFN